jgi:hypothetical protein
MICNLDEKRGGVSAFSSPNRQVRPHRYGNTKWTLYLDKPKIRIPTGSLPPGSLPHLRLPLNGGKSNGSSHP